MLKHLLPEDRIFISHLRWRSIYFGMFSECSSSEGAVVPVVFSCVYATNLQHGSVIWYQSNPEITVTQHYISICLNSVVKLGIAWVDYIPSSLTTEAQCWLFMSDGDLSWLVLIFEAPAEGWGCWCWQAVVKRSDLVHFHYMMWQTWIMFSCLKCCHNNNDNTNNVVCSFHILFV